MSEKIICYCKNVPESTIVQAIQDGARTLDDVKNKTGACTGNQCKTLNPKGICCSGDIVEIIERELNVRLQNKSCCGDC